MTLFFYGPSTYLLHQQTEQMVEGYLTKTGSDIGLERIDGSLAKPAEIRSALQAAPFLTSSRLVVITGLSTAKATFEKLGDPLALVPKTTVAVFAEPGIDQRTSAFKVLGAADKVIKFEPPTPIQLTNWVKRQVESRGGTIDRPAITALIKRAGDDQWRLDQEIAKLVSYAPTITPEIVALLVVRSPDATIFDLIEAATTGRVSDALAATLDLAAQKKDDMYVLTMVQWQLRNLLLAKVAPSGLTSGELAKVGGMSPYVASKMMTAAKKHDEAALRANVIRAADLEFGIKTGVVKSELGLEQLIFSLGKP